MGDTGDTWTRDMGDTWTQGTGDTGHRDTGDTGERDARDRGMDGHGGHGGHRAMGIWDTGPMSLQCPLSGLGIRPPTRPWGHVSWCK